ncbi:hypothetical protein F511_31903 [Dorcoceras hygrometricum]|uniref:Uncharacterized protein n=1 Tax=Dorcoceras hygrometricum TaxID=472368 RepID=A0A2Z7ABR0_9LAMI|nr:hypothetical protein F511_31903 [Dorcoceras hygrometricum]
MISWRSAKRRRIDKLERRRWYEQCQIQQIPSWRATADEDSADGIRVQFYRVLLRSANDSVLISWDDVVECTVSVQQQRFELVGTTAFWIDSAERS